VLHQGPSVGRHDYAVTVTHGRATDSSVLNVFIARIA
jgi:hypothetical protein